MYKTILVPLDGSPRAEAILPHIEELAQCHQSEIILLRVVELPGLSGYESYDPAWHKETLAQLGDEAATYLQEITGRRGHPFPAWFATGLSSRACFMRPRKPAPI